MNRTRARRPGLLHLVVVGGIMALLVLLGGSALGATDLVLAGDAPPAETTEPSTPGTEAPPETTEPDDETTDDGIGITGVALIVIGCVAVALIFLAGRGSSRAATAVQAPVPTAAPAPSVPPASREEGRQARMRSAYSATRAALDRLDARATAVRAAAADGDENARAVSHDLRRRIDAALSDLYGLEAEADTASSRSVFRETADALSALDRMIDDSVGVPPENAAGAIGSARNRLDIALDGLGNQIRGTA